MTRRFEAGPLDRDAMIRRGPTVRLSIQHDAEWRMLASRQGHAIPPPREVDGLLDTGANVCCIDSGLATAIGLRAVGRTTVRTTTGLRECPVYYAELTFVSLEVHLPFEDRYTLMGLDLGAKDAPILIGRNALHHGALVFTYDGRANAYRLES